MRLTPEQEAAYSLDYGVSRADLRPEVQAEYDRLLAEGRSTAPAVGPSERMAARHLPGSLRYARGLLWLQAGIWAWLATSGIFTLAVALTEMLAGHRAWSAAATVAGWLPAATVAGVLATTKIRLARRLTDGRDRIRKTVVGVEFAMAGLGALMTAGADLSGGMPADIVTLAALVGGGLSLAAAIGLLRRPAQEYFTLRGQPGSRTADSTTDSSTDGPGAAAMRVRIRLGIGDHLAVATCHA
ncbi:MAG: hypothetical protein J2P28_08500 [Actinobacteria bacterium]|nr:hypothetical protein [Actinomycetota bacterium]